jgi:hypothetical protein
MDLCLLSPRQFQHTRDHLRPLTFGQLLEETTRLLRQRRWAVAVVAGHRPYQPLQLIDGSPLLTLSECRTAIAAASRTAISHQRGWNIV